MPYHIAGIDVHKKMLAVAVADVEVDGDFHFERLKVGTSPVQLHALADWLVETPAARVAEKRREADLLFHRVGITFAVYGDKKGDERLIPFDIVPRVIPRAEWEELERGLKQRVTALNRFLHDIYHDQEILKAGRISAEQVTMHDAYQPVMRGLDLPNGVYSHIAGIDLVRHEDGLGMGDVKMLAMIGAFLGWQQMLLTLVLASFAGAIVGVGVIALQRGTMKYALPFGTFLALGALASMLAGQPLIDWYTGFY